MTGLIWKDVLVMRKTVKSYLLFLVFYVALAVLDLFSMTFVIAFIQVIMMMLPISAFAYDEQSKWDHYAMTLPIGRRAVVTARYLFVLLMLLSGTAFGLAVCTIIGLTGSSDGLLEYLGTLFVSLGYGIAIADIVLPLSYKFGPERARPYLYAVIFLPVVVCFGAFKLGLLDGLTLSAPAELSMASVLGLFTLIPLVAFLGLGVSYLISCRIVEQKEF